VISNGRVEGSIKRKKACASAEARRPSLVTLTLMTGSRGGEKSGNLTSGLSVQGRAAEKKKVKGKKKGNVTLDCNSNKEPNHPERVPSFARIRIKALARYRERELSERHQKVVGGKNKRENRGRKLGELLWATRRTPFKETRRC